MGMVYGWFTSSYPGRVTNAGYEYVFRDCRLFLQEMSSGRPRKSTCILRGLGLSAQAVRDEVVLTTEGHFEAPKVASQDLGR